MLVLALEVDRDKLDNVIYIGSDIKIELLEIFPNGRKQVRIGITAPKEVKVYRGKVMQERERNAQNNKNKSSSCPTSRGGRLPGTKSS